MNNRRPVLFLAGIIAMLLVALAVIRIAPLGDGDMAAKTRVGTEAAQPEVSTTTAPTTTSRSKPITTAPATTASTTTAPTTSAAAAPATTRPPCGDLENPVACMRHVGLSSATMQTLLSSVTPRPDAVNASEHVYRESDNFLQMANQRNYTIAGTTCQYGCVLSAGLSDKLDVNLVDEELIKTINAGNNDQDAELAKALLKNHNAKLMKSPALAHIEAYTIMTALNGGTEKYNPGAVGDPQKFALDIAAVQAFQDDAKLSLGIVKAGTVVWNTVVEDGAAKQFKYTVNRDRVYISVQKELKDLSGKTVVIELRTFATCGNPNTPTTFNTPIPIPGTPEPWHDDHKDPAKSTLRNAGLQPSTVGVDAGVTGRGAGGSYSEPIDNATGGAPAVQATTTTGQPAPVERTAGTTYLACSSGVMQNNGECVTTGNPVGQAPTSTTQNTPATGSTVQQGTVSRSGTTSTTQPPAASTTAPSVPVRSSGAGTSS